MYMAGAKRGQSYLYMQVQGIRRRCSCRCQRPRVYSLHQCRPFCSYKQTQPCDEGGDTHVHVARSNLDYRPCRGGEEDDDIDIDIDDDDDDAAAFSQHVVSATPLIHLRAPTLPTIPVYQTTTLSTLHAAIL